MPGRVYDLFVQRSSLAPRGSQFLRKLQRCPHIRFRHPSVTASAVHTASGRYREFAQRPDFIDVERRLLESSRWQSHEQARAEATQELEREWDRRVGRYVKGESLKDSLERVSRCMTWSCDDTEQSARGLVDRFSFPDNEASVLPENIIDIEHERNEASLVRLLQLPW
jgi:hypothetical protein